MLNTEVTALVWFALSFGYVFGNGLMFSVQAMFFSEPFGVRVRYSGVSFAYQVGGVLGGFVPFIVTALLAAAGGRARGWSRPSCSHWRFSRSCASIC